MSNSLESCNQWGVLLLQSEGLLLGNRVFGTKGTGTDVPGNGIEVSQGARGTVAGNLIKDNEGFGVLFAGSSGRVTDNLVEGSGHGGIGQAMGVEAVPVVRNRLVGNRGSGVAFQAHPAATTANAILDTRRNADGSGGHGILVRTSGSVRLVGDLVSNSEGTGLSLVGAAGSVVGSRVDGGGEGAVNAERGGPLRLVRVRLSATGRGLVVKDCRAELVASQIGGKQDGRAERGIMVLVNGELVLKGSVVNRCREACVDITGGKATLTGSELTDCGKLGLGYDAPKGEIGLAAVRFECGSLAAIAGRGGSLLVQGSYVGGGVSTPPDALGLLSMGGTARIEGTLVEGVPGIGVGLWETFGSSVRGCRIAGARGGGILSHTKDRAIVAENRVDGCGTFGIGVTGGEALVEGNLVTRTVKAKGVADSGHGLLFAAQARVEVRGNLVGIAEGSGLVCAGARGRVESNDLVGVALGVDLRGCRAQVAGNLVSGSARARQARTAADQPPAAGWTPPKLAR